MLPNNTDKRKCGSHLAMYLST